MMGKTINDKLKLKEFDIIDTNAPIVRKKRKKWGIYNDDDVREILPNLFQEEKLEITKKLKLKEEIIQEEPEALNNSR